MTPKKAPAKLPLLTLKKAKPAQEMPVDTGVIPVDSVELDQTVIEQVDSKGTDNPPEVTSVVVKGSKELVVTEDMTNAIAEAKRCVKDKMKKSEAAREVFDMLKGHERKQVVHVFIQGCGLSKAGASTYYQNCKAKKP